MSTSASGFRLSKRGVCVPSSVPVSTVSRPQEVSLLGHDVKDNIAIELAFRTITAVGLPMLPLAVTLSSSILHMWIPVYAGCRVGSFLTDITDDIVNLLQLLSFERALQEDPELILRC